MGCRTEYTCDMCGNVVERADRLVKIKFSAAYRENFAGSAERIDGVYGNRMRAEIEVCENCIDSIVGGSDMQLHWRKEY